MGKFSARYPNVLLCVGLIVLVGISTFSVAVWAQSPEPPVGAEDPGAPPSGPSQVSPTPSALPPAQPDEIPASLLPSGTGGPLIPYLPADGEYLDQSDPGLNAIIPFGGGGCTPITGAWKLAASLDNPVYGQAVASDGIYVYAAGGQLNPGTTNQLSRYDARANAWTALASLPTAVYSGLMVYAEGKLYVFGGLNSSSVVTDLVQVYSISLGTWSSVAPMPGVRSHLAGGYSTGKIYVTGGYASTSFNSAQLKTWEYSIADNTWAVKADLPAAVGGPGSAVSNGHFYVFGGRDTSGTNLSSAYDYDIAANLWNTRTPLPTGVNYPGTAVYSGRVWVFGGGNPYTGLSTTQIYDPTSNTWSSGPALNVSRSFQGGAAVRNNIVSVGGWGTASSNVVEVAAQPPLKILIVYSDEHTKPVDLQFSLMTQPGVGQVDTFDGQAATPTLAQLLAYDVVVPFSDSSFASSTALGDVLADFQDFGGVVVAFAFDWYGSYSIAGRWQSGGYSPFNNTSTTKYVDASLGTIHRAGHPLMAGVSALSAHYRLALTVASGAVPVASWSDGPPLLAYKGRAVGINAYVGDLSGGWSGDFAGIIANAGYTLHGTNSSCAFLACQGPTVIQGSLSVSDALQTGRLNRFSPSATCAAPKSCPSLGDATSRHFDLYSFWNNTDADQCVNVTVDAGTCTGSTYIHSSAYLDAYDPANLCTNYLADVGASPDPISTYSFVVPAWRNYWVVVNEITANAYCSAYTLRVTPSTCPIKQVYIPVVVR